MEKETVFKRQIPSIDDKKELYEIYEKSWWVQEENSQADWRLSWWGFFKQFFAENDLEDVTFGNLQMGQFEPIDGRRRKP